MVTSSAHLDYDVRLALLGLDQLRPLAMSLVEIADKTQTEIDDIPIMCVYVYMTC